MKTAFSRTFLVALLLCSAAWAKPQYDKALTLKASDLLPSELLAGPNFKVDEKVENDGFLNVYLVSSQWGELTVTSTPLLEKRIHELNAMAEMEKLKGTEEFRNGVAQAANRVGSGIENLVTDPGGSVKRIGRGVGGVFNSIGGAFSRNGQERGSTEGSDLERISGFNRTRRQYAERFGVDPYSRNELLQRQLSDVSRAGFLGNRITSMGLGMVGGRAVTVVGAAGTSGSVETLIHTLPPDRLRQRNRDTLSKMGVDEDLIDLFTRNTNFTVTEQTTIVSALSAMDKVEDRKEFVKFAVLTDNPDLASFRTIQAHLYSVYDQKWQKLDKFIQFGEFSCAQATDGTVVVVAPVDHLLWTEPLAEHITTLHELLLKSNPQGRRVLWITGSFSPLAEKSMKALGWELRPRALEKMKG
jgi:hypothetical protein